MEGFGIGWTFPRGLRKGILGGNLALLNWALDFGLAHGISIGSRKELGVIPGKPKFWAEGVLGKFFQGP